MIESFDPDRFWSARGSESAFETAKAGGILPGAGECARGFDEAMNEMEAIEGNKRLRGAKWTAG